MAVLGEMTIVFATNDFANDEEARKHLHKELLMKILSDVESVTGYRGKLNALDVTDLQIYDDIV